MINFKDFRNKIEDMKSRKSGLQHPDKIDHSRNYQRVGKELNAVPIPVDVHDEFEGKKGIHSLKPDESGKYKIHKGGSNKD